MLNEKVIIAVSKGMDNAFTPTGVDDFDDGFAQAIADSKKEFYSIAAMVDSPHFARRLMWNFKQTAPVPGGSEEYQFGYREGLCYCYHALGAGFVTHWDNFYLALKEETVRNEELYNMLPDDYDLAANLIINQALAKYDDGEGIEDIRAWAIQSMSVVPSNFSAGCVYGYKRVLDLIEETEEKGGVTL